MIDEHSAPSDGPPPNDEIGQRMRTFRADLALFDAPRLVQRYVTSGSCYVVDEEGYFNLRRSVADEFDLHPNEIYLVGSGKLGFSIAPKKRYRRFGDASDLDIALVSTALFDIFWKAAFKHYQSRAYWPDRDAFMKYLFRGWIRPDMLPPSDSFPMGQRWWDFFRGLTSSGVHGPYKIRAGLYRDMGFLESYHRLAIEACQGGI